MIQSRRKFGFSLIELLVVIALLALLLSLLLPALQRGRQSAQAIACLAHQRQIGLATRMYFDDHNGQFFRHHEGWVLDDGTQVSQLPTSLVDTEGGGVGHSEAEKPWIIFLQPYLANRKIGFCPSDPTARSQSRATNLLEFNGAIRDVSEPLPPNCELAIAEESHLTVQSYLLNSVLSHKSARFALEGVLRGFLTDTRMATLPNQSLIIYAERNSEAMNAPDNDAFGSVGQDDYDSWVGEAALVRWGPSAREFADEGWIRYNRHIGGANYVYWDGHAAKRRWRDARFEQFPDRVVRRPLADPPD